MLHAILLLQLLATPPEAHEAEALVHASMRDYDLGYFDQALREAEQAYRLYPLPQILFNIGQCHRALEHWERAAFFYRRFLSKFPNAPNRVRVQELLTEAEFKLKAEKLPAPPPPPAAVVVVPAPPAPVAPPAAALPAAPPQAVTAQAEPEKTHSHGLGIGLGVGGVAALVVAGVGLAEVISFNSYAPQSHATQTMSAVQSQVNGANSWGTAGIVCGILGVGGLTAAALTW